VVIAGGPAGIGAAIRASRGGAKVLLVELFGSLGGFTTNGYMYSIIMADRLAAEILGRMKEHEDFVDVLGKYPEIAEDPLTHYYYSHDQWKPDYLISINPDVCSCVMNDLVEMAGIKVYLRSQFVDVILEDAHIKAIVIENIAGRHAITGKVFIDATGRGTVMARSGVPRLKTTQPLMPMGLMWRVAGVNYPEVREYQKQDPDLKILVDGATRHGILTHYVQKRTDIEMATQDVIYTGHPRPEFTPTYVEDELLMWMPTEYSKNLSGLNADDMTFAEFDLRKRIIEEFNFLQKYVPGFKQARISGIAPFTGVREAVHYCGLSTLTHEDIVTRRRFEDTVVVLSANAMKYPEVTGEWFDVSLGCLLPQRIDNLLASGDNISASHEGFLHIRDFSKAMNLGEAAGIIASEAVSQGRSVKKISFPSLRNKLEGCGLLERNHG
jgi:hypothetical protein